MSLERKQALALVRKHELSYHRPTEEQAEELCKNHFMAYLSLTNQVLSTGWNKVQLDSKDYDPELKFDNTTNYRYTVSVAGYYVVQAGLRVQNTSGAGRYFAGFVYVGGVPIFQFLEKSFSASGTETYTGSFRFYLEKGAYLELFVYVDNGTGVSIRGHATQRCSFMGAKRDKEY